MTEQPRAAGPDATGTGPTPGGSTRTGTGDTPAAERIVIRDRRRIDPAASAAGADRGGRSGPADPGAAESTTTDNPTTATDEPVAADADGTAAESRPTAAADAPVKDETPVEPAETAESGTADGSEQTATPVADEEIAEMLAAQTPSGDDAPVVDEPAEPAEPTQTEGRGPFAAELEALRAELDERTRDLQRVSAEYANYRKRVDRDRGLMADQATGTVLAALLPILDDLDRARDHGDLVGPFGTVAEQLVAALGKFGLTPFGEPGDRFDPTRHEAVAHQTSADVTESTCVNVMRRGYLLGDRLLRPALVGVADPE